MRDRRREGEGLVKRFIGGKVSNGGREEGRVESMGDDEVSERGG